MLLHVTGDLYAMAASNDKAPKTIGDEATNTTTLPTFSIGWRKADPSADAQSTFLGFGIDKLVAAALDGRHKAAWRGPDAELYAHERRIIEERILTPALWGLGFAVSTFASFRIGRHFRISRSSDLASGGGLNLGGYRIMRRRYRPDAGSPADAADSKARLASDALSAPVDMLLSVLLGYSASLFLTDFEKLESDVVRLPLSSGRSLVSDELCGGFIAKFQGLPRDLRHDNGDGGGDALDIIRTFTTNCRKRDAYEKEIRRQKGSSHDSPVVIPWGGVPDVIPLRDDLLIKE